jgi:hypothetical protein
MCTRLLIAVFLLCCSTSILAQTTDDSADAAPAVQTAPQVKPPPASAAITGTVFCSDTHRPARGAMVMAQPIPKTGPAQPSLNAGTSRVGMDGTYTIQHLRPGDYTIVALLPGYISPFDDLQVDQVGNNDAEMRARLARNGIVSVRNNETANMDVTLTRGATITGRALYDDGAPATQVILSLEDVNAKPPAPKSAQAGNSDPDVSNVSAGAVVRGFFLHQTQGTDDQGNFRISGIKPGTYRIAAVQPAESLSDSDGDGFGIIFGVIGSPKSMRIYAGDTLHKNAAKTYELRAGDDITGVDITIPVYAFHRVQGQLAALDGRPIFVGHLTLTDTSDDSFVLHSVPARDGTFIFPEVPSGTYKLAVTAAQIGTLPDGFSEDVPVQAPMLQNAQAFTDKTTTVLVKDSDITDLSIQLQNAPASPNQPTAASLPATSQ